MTYLSRIFLALLLAGAVAHAQEDDDDPKAAPRHPSTVKSAPKPVAPAAPVTPPAAKPAKPEAPKAEVAPAAAAKTAKPEPATPATVKKTHTDEPAPVARKAEPVKKPAAEEPDPAPAPVVARKAAADEPAPRPSKRGAAAVPDPKASTPAELPVPANARAVRVRLVDGSTVVGSVRAEQAEQLVIDCALGQLAIPRVRISTIAYDAAAGVGKRAPVQMLDDGDTLPRKKPAP